MGAPNKQPTSPQRRVLVRQPPLCQTGKFVGDHSNTEKRLLKRVQDLERQLVQGTAKLVLTDVDPKVKQVDIPSSATDMDKDSRNKVVGTNSDPQPSDEEFSEEDLEGMPALLHSPARPVTEDSTRVRRIVIVKKKKKSPPLTPSLYSTNSGRKVTRKIIKKKKKRLHAGTLDQVLDSLQKELMVKGASTRVPTTSEEENFVMTLRRAEYWKGKTLQADTRVKHLERQKEQVERRLEHFESGVLERLQHIVSASRPEIVSSPA